MAATPAACVIRLTLYGLIEYFHGVEVANHRFGLPMPNPSRAPASERLLENV